MSRYLDVTLFKCHAIYIKLHLTLCDLRSHYAASLVLLVILLKKGEREEGDTEETEEVERSTYTKR